MNYRQCLMVKRGTEQTAWIPEKFSKTNKVLKIKIDGEWDEGWEVRAVYEPAVEEGVVNERSRDYKKIRVATDI